MARGWFEGWRGVVVTAAAGTLATASTLAVAVLATRDDAGLDRRVFDEPGAVAVPGRLECAQRADAVPAPVGGPQRATDTVALPGGEVLVAGADGALWRGEPGAGLREWAPQPAVGGVTALGRSPLPDHVFAAGPDGLAAVDLASGDTVSRQPFPAQAAAGVVDVQGTNRRVYLEVADGTVLEATWSYHRLGAVGPLDADEPPPPVAASLVSPDGEVLLVGGERGPLRRQSLVNGRGQEVPVGDDVRVTAMSLGPGGLVYLSDGSNLRVLDLNERWVTGRLSGPVDGWSVPAAGLTATEGGLLVTGPDGALTLVPYPQCNREELTRLTPPTG